MDSEMQLTVRDDMHWGIGEQIHFTIDGVYYCGEVVGVDVAESTIFETAYVVEIKNPALGGV